MTTAAARPTTKTSIKETFTSILIALVMAFVFRGFVIEAFVIPTGSMAPTLYGQHVRFIGPQSGYRWDTNPWEFYEDANGRPTAEPLPVQSNMGPLGNGMNYSNPQSPTQRVAPPGLHDPMTQQVVDRTNLPTEGGDRIFVMKYLYSVNDPHRYDAVVFKNPNDPTVNYIKRLIGLPGEMVALIDGDVFVRTPTSGDASESNPWKLPGWHVARKPERAQRTMWQDVFDSRYAPLKDSRDGSVWFKPPWLAGSDPAKWEIGSRRDYRYTGTGATSLVWDAAQRPIIDSYAYDEPMRTSDGRFPVSDVRMSLGIRPDAAGVKVAAVLAARGHEFRCDIDGAAVTLRMRPLPPNAQPGEWTTLGKGTLPEPLTAGKVTNLDFWHSDQALRLYCGETEIAWCEYDWTPAQRVQFSMLGETVDSILHSSASLSTGAYVPPKPRWEFSGGPFTLYRVALARDIHYQPAVYHTENERGLTHTRAGLPANATHPASTLSLSPDQFFVCGDNSPASLDARLWDKPNPWVAEIDPTIGVVHRDLLIGKAFFVYFPAPLRGVLPWVPDFGKMRFIW